MTSLPPFSSLFTEHGESSILHVVQMARIFPDSKTFVDMALKSHPDATRRAFARLMTESAGRPAKADVAAFVATNFDTPDQLEVCEPADWTDAPRVLRAVADPEYRRFAADLNARWKTLTRRVPDAVRANPERHTLIHLPHPVVVPGGRFREIYYWDSFWIVRGLLLCDMRDTVKGMLRNFAHLVERFGKIPNGGRTYYVCRSQPPVFALMVDEYVRATGDTHFLLEAMPAMAKEFDYWMAEHMVTVNDSNGKAHRLARYNCEDDGPRPESYVEDYELAQAAGGSEEDKRRLYWELKTGAESGWDFSSRWMVGGDGLENLKITQIAPVDLNAFLAQNARILARYASAGAEEARFAAAADDLEAAMDALLWHAEDGVWYDLDLADGTHRRAFTPSNLVPLWTQAARRPERAAAAVAYVERQDLLRFPGGVPSTTTPSGQQWDFPNVWPPLEHMLVEGLERTGLPAAKELAFRIAERRVRGAFVNAAGSGSGDMFEKYDATAVGKQGGGGEYDVQVGFGWSNGVVLDFLNTYGQRLVAPNNDD